MDIKYRNSDSGLTFYVHGELDEFSASTAKNILDKIISDNPNSRYAVFDLSGLSFMDSTGIGLLIGRYKKLKRFSIPAYIQGAPCGIEKVLELSGIYEIMPKVS